MKGIELLHIMSSSTVNIIEIALLLIILILFICFIVPKEEPVSPIYIIIFCTFVGAIFLPGAHYIISKNYRPCVNIKHESVKLNVDSLPNDIVSTETNVFIVNEKQFPTIKDGDVLYRKDSKGSPYIIVDKITFEAPDKWYVSSKSTKEINKDVRYILKELHH